MVMASSEATHFAFMHGPRTLLCKKEEGEYWKSHFCQKHQLLIAAKKTKMKTQRKVENSN